MKNISPKDEIAMNKIIDYINLNLISLGYSVEESETEGIIVYEQTYEKDVAGYIIRVDVEFNDDYDYNCLVRFSVLYQEDNSVISSIVRTCNSLSSHKYIRMYEFEMLSKAFKLYEIENNEI